MHIRIDFGDKVYIIIGVLRLNNKYVLDIEVKECRDEWDLSGTEDYTLWEKVIELPTE